MAKAQYLKLFLYSQLSWNNLLFCHWSQFALSFSSADVLKEKNPNILLNVGQKIPHSSGNCNHKHMNVVVLGIFNFLLLCIDVLKQEFLIPFLNILPTEL